MASVEANQMLAVAAAACEDKKAEDIRILALDPAESGLSDYFLICTGTNDRQTVAITDEIEIRLKREFGAYPNAVEGRRQGEWILMDYVDFIVHVFLPERRAFYGLERLRSSATTLSVADLDAEIKSAIKAERAGKKTRVAVLDDAEKSADEAVAPRKKAPRKIAAEAEVTTQKASRKVAGKKLAAKKPAEKKAVGTPPAKTAGKTAGKRAAKAAQPSPAKLARGAATGKRASGKE